MGAMINITGSRRIQYDDRENHFVVYLIRFFYGRSWRRNTAVVKVIVWLRFYGIPGLL